MSDEATPTGTPAVEVLRRWERSGAIWRVASRTADSVEVSLMTCTGDQEVDRLVSHDPELVDFLEGRTRSDE